MGKRRPGRSLVDNWRAILAVVFTMSTVCGVAVGAILADGRPGSESHTNDGGAWLINRQLGVIGHIDRVTREVSRVAGPFGGLFDVDQAPGVVLVRDATAGTLSLIDTARASERSTTSIDPTIEVVAAPGAVVLFDPAAGDVWRLGTDDFVSVSDLTAVRRTVEAGGPVAVTVGRSGRVAVVDPGDGTVRRIAPDGSTSDFSDPVLDGLVVDHLTTVGRRTVVAAGPEILVIDGDDVSRLRHDRAIATLQQPGLAASAVVAVTEGGLVVSIDLEDGTVTEELALQGSEPLPPIVHEGCIHAVTTAPAPVYHFCDRSAPLPGAGAELRLRLVNNWVWVNDVNQGQIWFVTLDDLELQQISDWSSALPQEDEIEPAEGSTNGDHRERFTPDGELPDELNNLDEDGENSPPEAEEDEAATRSGRAIVIDVVANDRDEDNDPLVVESVGEGRRATITGGVVTITADGRAVQFVPEPGFTGSTSVEYTIHDGRGGRDRTSLSITVLERTDAGNRPPETESDNGTVRAGRSVSMNLLDNDSDPDGDVLVLVDVVDDGTGTITFSPEGDLTYSPDITSPEGVLQLEYTVRDDYGAEAGGTVRIRVRPPDSNQRPFSRNDVAATVVGEAVVIDVLANDADPDGDPLSAFNLTAVDPPGAVATLTPGGTFLFTPEAPGTHIFLYSASDGPESTPAQIRVEVEAVSENRPPVPVVDELALVVGDTRVVRVLDNDADPDGDVVGLVDWSGVDGLDITEVPGVGFSVRALPDAPARISFPYFVSDGDGDPVGSSVVVSTIVADPVDYPPVAEADVIDVRPGQPTLIPVLANDHDPEGGPLVVATPLADVDEGILQLAPDGQGLIITVDADRQFSFAFGYDVEDDGGNRASASVQVRIVPPEQTNRPPTAAPDTARTPHATDVIVPVLANDADPDGDPLIIEGIAEQPANGLVTINEDRTITYAPRPGFAGTDRFSYLLTDGVVSPAGDEGGGPGDTGRSIGVVSIGVMPEAPANRPPSAIDDDRVPPVSAGGDGVIIGVLANDSDPDGDPLSVVDVTVPAAGTAEIADGGIRFVPPAESEARSISFSYTIADGRGGSDQALVTVAVEPDVEPEPPIAVNDQTGPHPAGDVITIDPRTNDTDPDATPGGLRVDPPGDGSFQVNGDGTITLTVPEATASIPYRVVDGDDLRSEPALITVLVAENLAPVVPVRTVETEFNTGIDIALHEGVVDPEGDDLLYVLGANRRGGSVSPVGTPAANSFTVRFTPDTDFEGPAGFDFLVDDQHGHQVSSTVVVTVLPPSNRPPTATDQTVDAQAGIDTPIDLTAFVDDPDLAAGQETLTFSVANVSGPIGATGGGGGPVTVTSALDDGGDTGRFEYTVTDAAGESATGSVTVNLITADFPAPTAVDDTAGDFQGSTIVIPALDNDADNLPPAQQGGLTITSVGAATGGTTTTDGRQITFTPQPDFFGTTSFTYTVQDARASDRYQATATVTIDIVGRPDAPTPPTVGPPNDGELTLPWTAPADNGGPITGYLLEYRGSDGSTGSAPLSTPSTNHTWTGLTNAVTYTFTLAAINDAGQGEFSSPSLPATPDVRPEVPAAPPIPQFGDGRLTVTWSAPLSRGSAIVDYEIEIGGASSGTASTGSATTTYDWTGLTNGDGHVFRVRARNSATNDNDGWSDWSPWSQPEHSLTSPDAPGQPSAVRGDRQIEITWSAPADGGDPITSYEIRRAGAGTVIPVTPLSAGTQTYTWTDLANGQPVSFEVRAVNRDPDPGAWSPASPVVVPCSVPDAPTNLVAGDGDRQIPLSWSQPNDQGCRISEYRIVAQPGGTQQTSTSTSHVFTGLTNGVAYTFTVAAVNEVVTVDGAAPVFGAGVSAVPAGLPIGPTLSACTNTGPRTIRCDWAAADPNGSPITRYEIQVGSSWQDAGTGTSFTYTAPANGAAYSFRVRAVNGVGTGPASNQISVTTWDLPGQPNVNVSAASNQVTASWPTPGNGGTALTAHQAKLTTGNCSAGGTTRNNPGSAETFTGLADNTTYRVCVRYQNAVGWGPWGSDTARTPPPPQPTVTIGWSTIGNAQGLAGCSSSQCTWINTNISNFAPNTTYTQTCQEQIGGSWSTFYTRTITTNGAGAAGNQPCYFGIFNRAVRVVVNSVGSNGISHPR